MEQEIEETVGLVSTENRFIEANTINTSLEEITSKHVIPVFTKFNEPLISHSDFIGITQDVIKEVFPREVINEAGIRVSHPVKGRIPEAKNKASIDLLDHERTLYYERMAFMIEIPTIFDTIGDNLLSLTVGGVKAYNLDNYNSNRKEQKFKLFIGFKNSVCTNLCISTDGLKTDVSVRNFSELKLHIKELIENYNASYHLESIRRFAPFELSDNQVSYLVGRLKMFNHLPGAMQRNIHDLRLTESQLNTVLNGHFNDPNFKRFEGGGTNLWKLYNNLTEGFKSSYIDNYLEKTANAHTFMGNIAASLEGINNSCSWYIN